MFSFMPPQTDWGRLLQLLGIIRFQFLTGNGQFSRYMIEGENMDELLDLVFDVAVDAALDVLFEEFFD